MDPAEWIKGVQNWFGRTERSSGFRPFLIFLIVHFGFSIVLLSTFSDPLVRNFVINTLYFSIGVFLVLYLIKAFQQPEFCRSEKHIETIKKLDIEMLGTKEKQAKGRVVEAEMDADAKPDEKLLQ